MEITKSKKSIKFKRPLEIIILLGIFCLLAAASLYFYIWLQPVVLSSSGSIAVLKFQALFSLFLYLSIVIAIIRKVKFAWYLSMILLLPKILYSIYETVLNYNSYGFYSSIIGLVIFAFLAVLILRKRVLFYFKIGYRYKMYRFYKSCAAYIKSKPVIIYLIVMIQIYIGGNFTYYTFASLFNNLSSLALADKGDFYYLAFNFSRVLHSIAFLCATIGVLMQKKWGYQASLIFFMVLGFNHAIEIISLDDLLGFFIEGFIRHIIGFTGAGVICWYLAKSKIVNANKRPVKALLLISAASLAISLLYYFSLNALVNI
ncbi:MAG TPA: hypothetical protein VEB00_16430 [Clostridia bacterium]|nr:hypothetical protein [Clostridia bacterium]